MSPVIGIDLGGTRLRVALGASRGRPIRLIRRPTEAAQGPEHVINRLVEAVDDVLQAARIDPRKVAALAIGMPGPADDKTGVVYSPPNLPGWDQIPIAAILRRRTGIRSFLQNDANLAALGESRLGAGRGARDLAYVTVSTGIGAGLILEGSLYSGASGVAGEIGHIVIEPGGPLCNCGHRGCLEAISSGTGIARAAREGLKGRTRSLLRQVKTKQGPTAADVVKAARRGDALALRILDRAGTGLGIGLGTLINLVNPQTIVLGGSVMNAGAYLTGPMRLAMAASSWESARRNLRIVVPALGQDAGLIGALEWARLHARA